ncbi:MAG: NAD-dependent epimerase/dehydratase family protein [Clostridiales bacterium]|jgi:dTDP-4-dehydrorhamnose 3,5-epimerase|nr:NAD-dependent epimerase/dehydratase family protein [Clostridiales bacterium]
MKRVLVTGATGFLGKYLVEELINNGYEVVAQGRKENILNNLKEQYKVNILKCSLNEIKNIDMNIDCVIHAAALSTVWGKWQDFYDSNVLGTENVIKFCLKNNVRRLIYVSSPSVYSAKFDRFNIKEEDFDKNNKLNFYIKSKILAENLINKIDNQKLETVIIRPRGLFGIGDTSLVPRLINANSKIGIPLFNDGKNIVDITCVENVAYSLRLAMEKEEANGNIYNITNGDPTEFKNILDKLFTELEERANYRKMNINLMYFVASVIELFYKLFRIYKEPMITKYTIATLGYSQSLNIEKAKKDLDYNPKITLEEGIKKYAEHERKKNNRS